MKRGIRKYRTFLEARLDMYREMWKRGFQEKRVARFLKEFADSLRKYNHPASKILYKPGLYFFESFEQSQRDLEMRIKENDNP